KTYTDSLKLYAFYQCKNKQEKRRRKKLLRKIIKTVFNFLFIFYHICTRKSIKYLKYIFDTFLHAGYDNHLHNRIFIWCSCFSRVFFRSFSIFIDNNDRSFAIFLR